MTDNSQFARTARVQSCVVVGIVKRRAGQSLAPGVGSEEVQTLRQILAQTHLDGVVDGIMPLDPLSPNPTSHDDHIWWPVESRAYPNLLLAHACRLSFLCPAGRNIRLCRFEQHAGRIGLLGAGGQSTIAGTRTFSRLTQHRKQLPVHQDAALAFGAIPLKEEA